MTFNKMNNSRYIIILVAIISFLIIYYFLLRERLQQSFLNVLPPDEEILFEAKYADLNFTDSKRPKLLRPFDGSETQHICLGGEDELRQYGPLTRHCVFKNICYKVSSQQWLYYTGDKNTPRAVGVHIGNQNCKENCETEDPFIYTDFESAKSPFVSVQFDGTHVTPVVLYDRIPENAFFDKGQTESTIHVHSLIANDAPFGHMLAEFVYPIFHGLDIVGVRDRDVKLLFASSPCPSGHRCSLFYEAIKSFSKYYPQVSDIAVNYPPATPPDTYHPDLVCYRLLYLGTGQLHGSSRVHHPDSWGRFIEKIIYGMGLDPFHKPQKQRVLVINKGGPGANRVAFNGRDVAEKIRQQFQVDVDYYEYSGGGASFRQEVEMVQQYTVCITVCGGTAFGCTFLPDGAANIYIATWHSEGENGRPGASNNMEHVTWTYDRRHKYYAYPVWINETTPDMSAAGYSPHYKFIHRWKYNKGFTIDFPRMALLVNDALSYAEDSFDYGKNSFKRLQKVTRYVNNFTIL
jgi:hypothetical protein